MAFFMIAANENSDGIKVEKDIKATLKEIHKIDLNDERAIRAVSYTHLRAYETREDLVCCLLLEKKKARYVDVARVVYLY